MNETIFVIGGCKSGKSRYALETADYFPGRKRVFIATCIPNDEEMKQRVVQHQKERSRNWDTVEAPVLLPDAIVEHSREARVLLVDCLTLWISNLLAESEDAAHILEQIANLTQAMQTANCPVVLVSNEVGTGIVPENKLARLFRDLIGSANQAVAKQAGKVVWMVAGIPMTIKG